MGLGAGLSSMQSFRDPGPFPLMAPPSPISSESSPFLGEGEQEYIFAESDFMGQDWK